MTVHAPSSQGFAVLTGPNPAVLDMVLAATEVSFVETGSSLEKASHALRSLQELFPRLQSEMGPEADEAFSRSVDSLQSAADHLLTQLGSFVNRTIDLDRTAGQVDREIADLDRIVRTIATLSITARVLGHAIIPPEPKVAAFVENLSRMAAEAEENLVDVKAAMSDIRHEIEQISEVVAGIQGVLSSQVMTLLNDLTGMARGLLARRPELAQAGRQLGHEMQQTSAEVSRLIIALQIGDTFRQRLVRVRATLLGMVALPTDASVAVGQDLAAALLKDARHQLEEEVRAAIQALDDLDHSSQRAIALATRAYLHAGDQQKGQMDLPRTARALDARLSEVDQSISALRIRTAQLVDRIHQMLLSEKVLRQIAHKVRLAGLNAVVICTQLGDRGNALREVAQWLRGITDDADEATERLQKELDAMRSHIAEVGEEGLSKLSDGMARVVSEGRGLQTRITESNKVIGQATLQIGRLGKDFPVLIAPAKTRLVDFLARTQALNTLDLELALLSRRDADLGLPFAPETEEAQMFASLREKYTMEAERVVHDRILFPDAPERSEKKVETKPAVEVSDGSDADDLDDILF